MKRTIPDRKDVGLDTPLRLHVAALLAYPDGSMTASGLRREAARKRLAIECTAGKFYTTLRAVEEMRALCRVTGNGRACGCAQNDEMPEANSPAALLGSS